MSDRGFRRREIVAIMSLFDEQIYIYRECSDIEMKENEDYIVSHIKIKEPDNSLFNHKYSCFGDAMTEFLFRCSVFYDRRSLSNAIE